MCLSGFWFEEHSGDGRLEKGWVMIYTCERGGGWIARFYARHELCQMMAEPGLLMLSAFLDENAIAFFPFSTGTGKGVSSHCPFVLLRLTHGDSGYLP